MIAVPEQYKSRKFQLATAVSTWLAANGHPELAAAVVGLYLLVEGGIDLVGRLRDGGVDSIDVGDLVQDALNAILDEAAEEKAVEALEDEDDED